MEQEISGQEGQEKQVELSPVEQQALDQGWVPKEEFHGEEHKWVPADEFLRRGELFKKIESQNRELKDVKRALVEMKKLHSEVREVEYKRALETLRAQKKEAIEEGDAEAIIAADERIDLIKEAQSRLKQEIEEAPQTGDAHPEFVAWKEKNSWYSSNAPMKAFADALGNDLASQGYSPSEVLKRVEQEVRKEFAHKFQNPRQSRQSVEGTSGRGTGTGKGFQLTPEQRKIMNTFVRSGAMTEEEYIRDLKKIEGVD